MRPTRVAAIVVLAAGLGLSSFALLLYSGASMPYQDASPELLAQQAKEMQDAGMLFAAGLAAMAVGGVGIWTSRVSCFKR